MEKLTKLSRNLEKCKILSKKIIQSILPFMRDLSDENEFIKSFEDEYPEKKEEELEELVKKVLLEMVDNPEKILKEIDGFSKTLLEDGKNILNYHEEYPFLLSVWCGDVYGEDENAGLSLLVDDLKQTFENVEDEESFLLHIKTYLDIEDK